MKIIGHRGAAGLALENSIEAFTKALEVRADMIELDVRITADRRLVVSHGDNLNRLGGGDRRISELTAAELQRITLENGSPVPTLEAVLKLVNGSVPLIIEIKTEGGLEPLLEEMERFPGQAFSIASPKHQEIKQLRQLRPDIKGYPRAICNPILAIYRAKRYGAAGVDMYDWWLPLVYLPCRLLKLEIIVFTVNHKRIGELIGKLFPRVMLCTNYPDQFIKR